MIIKLTRNLPSCLTLACCLFVEPVAGQTSEQQACNNNSIELFGWIEFFRKTTECRGQLTPASTKDLDKRYQQEGRNLSDLQYRHSLNSPPSESSGLASSAPKPTFAIRDADDTQQIPSSTPASSLPGYKVITNNRK